MSALTLQDDSFFKMGYYTTSTYTATFTSSSIESGTAVTATHYTYSPVYLSNGGQAACVEQIFTQSTDPRPGTEDWTNPIVEIPYGWTEFAMSAWATSTRIGEGVPSPICRATYAPWSYSQKSAKFPVDGVNTGFDWTSQGGNTYYATSKWYDLTRIMGSLAGGLIACVSVWDPMYSSLNSSNAEIRQAWEEGRRTLLAGSDRLSGAVQFRYRTVETAITSKVVTSTYTASAVSAVLHTANTNYLGIGE